MVLGKIATEAVKIGVTYGSRFVRLDKHAWNKLYTGFPKYVKKGTREGFLVGSTLGGLAKGLYAPDTPGNDAVPQQRYESPTRSPYKTRSGQTSRFGTRYGKQYKSRFNCR